MLIWLSLGAAALALCVLWCCVIRHFERLI